MENSSDLVKDKVFMDKAKSHCNGPMKDKNITMKRKSFNVNEAVLTLDEALCRLKKSKLVNSEYDSNIPVAQVRVFGTEAGMGNSSSYFAQGRDNASLLSMNFSHYELKRNLSCSNCNSECTFSGNTCSSPDPSVKHEHLERFFRSAEMWTQNFKRAGTSSVRFEVPEK